MTEQVFVYGTLKRGESRDLSTLPGIKAKFVTEGNIFVGILRDMGPFPGLFLNETGDFYYTEGEIWEVDDLKVLDHIEGVRQGLYSRGRVNVKVQGNDKTGGYVTEAWTYFCIGIPGEKYPVVESGNWTAKKGSG